VLQLQLVRVWLWGGPLWQQQQQEEEGQQEEGVELVVLPLQQGSRAAC
jgi:hypothetical protein